MLIDYLRDRRQAVQFLEAQPEAVVVSAMSVVELYQGLRGHGEESQLTSFLVSLQVEPMTTAIAIRAGLIARQYGPSHGTGPPDCVIAATAELLGLRLATLNLRHFPMLPDAFAPYSRER